MILDKDDVRALRKADSISFVMSDDGALVLCFLEDAWAGEIKTLSVADQKAFPKRADVTSARVREIGPGKHDGSGPMAYRNSIQYSQTWPTIAASLRTGDDIGLLFMGDHLTTPAMKKAGLHGDVLFIVVTRGKKQYTYQVLSSINPDNSNRMVKDRYDKVSVWDK